MGAGAHVGPHCSVGPRTRLRERSMLVSHTTLGAGNDVHPNAVLGGDPQDLKFRGDPPGRLLVGDENVFREGVTVSRSVGEEIPTRVGAGTYWMANAHAGHNVQIGDRVILANGVCLAGHVRVGAGCFLGGNAVAHQFTDIGELVMLQGLSGIGMHAPPYLILSGVNEAAGVNVVGLRRSGRFTAHEITEAREFYRMVLHDRRRTLAAALDEARARPWGSAASAMLAFIEHALTFPPPRRRGVVAGARTRDQSEPAGV